MTTPNDDTDTSPTRPAAPELAGLSVSECGTNLETWANDLLKHTHNKDFLRVTKDRQTAAFITARDTLTQYKEKLSEHKEDETAETVNTELRELCQALDNEITKVWR